MHRYLFLLLLAGAQPALGLTIMPGTYCLRDAAPISLINQLRCDSADTTEATCRVSFHVIPQEIPIQTAQLVGPTQFTIGRGSAATITVQVQKIYDPSRPALEAIEARVDNCAAGATGCARIFQRYLTRRDLDPPCNATLQNSVYASLQTPIFLSNPASGAFLVRTSNADAKYLYSGAQHASWGRLETVRGRFSGGGLDDLLTYDSATGAVNFYTANAEEFGGTTYASYTLRSGPLNWGTGLEVHAGDFDGDGRDEILRYRPLTGEAVITRFAGNPLVAADIYTANGWGFNIQVHVANLDADPAEELFRYSPSSGFVFVTKMLSGATQRQDKYNGYGWGNGIEMHFGNFDANGDKEILRYDPVSGEVLLTSLSADLMSFQNHNGPSPWVRPPAGANRRIYVGDLYNRPGEEVLIYDPATGTARMRIVELSINAFYPNTLEMQLGANRQFQIADLTGNGRPRVLRYDGSTGLMSIFSFTDGPLNDTVFSFDQTGFGTGLQVRTSNRSYYRNY